MIIFTTKALISDVLANLRDILIAVKCSKLLLEALSSLKRVIKLLLI